MPSKQEATRAAILRSARLIVDSPVLPKRLRAKAAKALAQLRAGDLELSARLLSEVAARFRMGIDAEVHAMASVFALLAAVHYLNDDPVEGARATRMALKPYQALRRRLAP